MFKLKWYNEAPQITIERMDEPTHCHEINTEEVVDQPRFHEVKRYLEAQEYPEGASINDKKFLRRFLLSSSLVMASYTNAIRTLCYFGA